MRRFSQVKWSIVEIDYLKAHRNDMSENQLSLVLAKSRNAIKNKLLELDGKKITKKMNKRSVIGKREDLKTFMRSNWESNVARWLNYLEKKWKYEPEVFSFLNFGIKHGTVSYCPDFLIDDGWIEVKGFLDTKGKTAIRRFKKYYPEEFKKLKAIVGRPNTNADKFFKQIGVPIMAYYNELSKEYGKKIPNWE